LNQFWHNYGKTSRIETLDPASLLRLMRNENHFQKEVINHTIILVRRAFEATNPDMTVQDGDVWSGKGKLDITFVHWEGRGTEDDELVMRFPVEGKLSFSWKTE
jgi:hypothetical protein